MTPSPVTPQPAPLPLSPAPLAVADLDLGAFGAASLGASTVQVTSTPPEGAPPEGNGDRPSLFDGMLPFLAIGLVLWLLIFGPEKKARKQRQAMLEALKKGDKVITSSGLHAEIVSVKEHEVELKAGGSQFTYSRAAVNEVLDS